LPDYSRDVYWLCDAKKNRDGPPFNFMAKHFVNTGKVEEIDDPSKAPKKDEKKAMSMAIKDAEIKAAGTATVKADPPPVPVVKTGIRDEAMGDLEAVEGDADNVEDVVEPASLDAEEARAIGELIGGDEPVAHIEPLSAPSKGSDALPVALDSILQRFRARKIPLGDIMGKK
jgi:hypothetical protein